MPIASRASVALTSSRPAEVETDLLIVPVFEGENAVSSVPGLDEAAGGAVKRAGDSGELQGRLYELFLTPLSDHWRAGRVAFIGAGKAAEFDTERLRKVATAAALLARQRRIRRIAFLPRGGSDSRSVQAIAEGVLLASFSGDRYKSGERSGPPVEEALIIAGDSSDSTLEAAVERGRIMGECCNIARDLCNEPSNLLTPSLFAERGSALVRVGVG